MMNFSPTLPKCACRPMVSHWRALSTTLARSWRGTFSTLCHRCFGEITRCVFPTGERPAFCLDCWPLHGSFSHLCLAVTRLLRDIVAKYSRQPRATTRRYGTTSGPFYLVRHGCLPVTPRWGNPSLLLGSFFSLSSPSMSLTKMLPPPLLITVALTAPTTTMGPPRCRPPGCRRHRCSSHGGGVTARCRPANPGNADGSLGLYLRGQAVTSPRVSISRS